MSGITFHDQDTQINLGDTPTIAFDVDQTLVIWDDNAFNPGPGKYAFNLANRTVYLKLHNKHLFYLRSYKARGFKVVVWSAAGGQWANEVVRVLNLEQYIDVTMSKFTAFYDDLKAEEVLGQHLYFHDTLDGEEWRPVSGYEGLYEVSDYGRVRSLNKFGEKLIKDLSYGSGSYVTVQLSKNKKRKSFLVHRLVAEAFNPNPMNLKVVHHKDGKRHNNNAYNLEWVSSHTNNLKKTKKPRTSNRQGTFNGSCKLSEQNVLDIHRDLYNNNLTVSYVAKKYNISRTQVYHIKNGKSWKHLTKK